MFSLVLFVEFSRILKNKIDKEVEIEFLGNKTKKLEF